MGLRAGTLREERVAEVEQLAGGELHVKETRPWKMSMNAIPPDEGAISSPSGA
jgi:hypothetical protein